MNSVMDSFIFEELKGELRRLQHLGEKVIMPKVVHLMQWKEDADKRLEHAHKRLGVTQPANRHGVTASGRTWCAKYTVQKGERRHVRRQMTEKLMSGQFDRVVFELCCEEDSVLSMNVIGRSLTVRVTEALNLADSRTVRDLNAILRVAEHMNIDVHIWISIPCTAGCTWQRVNRARGFRTGDINFTKELIRVALAFATYVIKIEGKVYWEWPETNDLWRLVDVQRFIDKWELKPVLIASSAVGMMFHVPRHNKEVYVKKRWKIVTNNSAFVAESQHLVHPPKSLCEIDFVQCCGKIAKQTARYTPEFARHFWQTIVPSSRRPVVVQSRCLETSDQKSCTHLAEQVRSLSKRTDTKAN